MKIEILEEGIVFCGGCVCDPIGLWITNQHCDKCPMIDFAERFWISRDCDFTTPLFEDNGNDSKAL